MTASSNLFPSGAPSPSPQPAWSTTLPEPPAGPPLLLEDTVLIPTHEPGRNPRRATLHWLRLADGRPLGEQRLAESLVGGLASVPPSTSPQRGEDVRAYGERPPSTSPQGGEDVPASPPLGGTEGGLTHHRPSQALALITTYSTDPLQSEGTLLAFDAAGQERWRWSSGASGLSAPALVGDTVWLTTSSGSLVALDLMSERVQAQITLNETPSLAAPLPAGGVAYVPCRGPRLLAVGLEGQVRWRFVTEQAGAWLDKTPVVVGERLFAVLNLAGAVAALRITDGTLLWQVPLGPKGKPLTAPAADGERLYLGSRAGLHALDLADGREVWRWPVERGLVAGPILAGRIVYAAGRDHHLYALEAATGRAWWRYRVERRLEVPPLITAGPRPLALIADQGGTVTTIERPRSEEEVAVPLPSEEDDTPFVIPHQGGVIRQLLQALFTDEALTVFCFDHFQPVYKRFTAGTRLSAKIQSLVKYCETNNKFSELLTLVEQTYPQPYRDFKPAAVLVDDDLVLADVTPEMLTNLASPEADGDTLILGYREVLKIYRQNLVQVERQIAKFFDEAAVPPDLIRGRDSLLKRIAETEAKIEAEMKKKVG